MHSVGEILKRSRESKKISIIDVSKELNISREIIINFETDYFKKDINSVFTIGHLRSYCALLELNFNEIVDQFKKEHFTDTTQKIEINRPIFNNKLLFSNKLISLSVILFVFAAFYFLFIEVENTSRQYAIIPDLPENYISIVEKANLDEEIKNKKIKTNEIINFAKLEIPSNSSSAIASMQKEEDSKSPIVTLKILDDTWVQLRDENNKIIISQLMNKDDEFSYDLYSNYSITSGNAGHIMILINNKVRGKAGKKGQIVDTLVLNSDFKN
jgi:cytoskeletal protein RodZ